MTFTSFSIFTLPNNPSKRLSFCPSNCIEVPEYPPCPPLPLAIPPPYGLSEYCEVAEPGRGNGAGETRPDEPELFGGKRTGDGDEDEDWGRR